MRSDTTIYRPRVRQSPRRIALRRAVFLAVVLGVVAVILGLAFAGSRTELAAGTTIAGVDVSGMSEDQAVRLLSARAAALKSTPVTFTADGHPFALTASQLGVEPDWRGAVATAAAGGSGFGPLRGFRRLRARIFGIDVSPTVKSYGAAVRYKLAQIADSVDRKGVNAKVVREGLAIRVVDGMTGRQLDRNAAGVTVVAALATFDRGKAVALPLETTEPKVKSDDLAGAATQARTALSAPIRLSYGATRWRVPRWRIAPLLSLPANGSTSVSISGRGAEEYLERLSATVSRKPEDAHFQVTATGKIVIRPSAPGLQLDVPATAKAITAAAFSADKRTANLVVRVADPKRTTEIAKTMGIDSVVSSYTTTYGGTPGRLNNVQLVAKLIDGTLIAPGDTFSFNGTTGERTADKGFQEAPVIINGELQNGLGGGICQVSTTVFNAAFEAGLPITARTNHALYISHYPLGRDATVNYPDLDLKFRQRHGALAAAADVRRRRLADRQPLRHARQPPGREHDRAARRDRAGAGEGDGRPDAREGQARHGRVRRAAARDQRPSPRLRRRREAPLRQHVEVVLRGRALARPARDEGAAEEACQEEAEGGRSDHDDTDRPDGHDHRPDGHDADGDDSRSAVAIASTNHGGTRVGCRVAASTVAWSVSAVAINSPSRSIRYS